MSDLARAKKLYRAFREDEPRKVKRMSFTMPRAVMVMGRADFIGYTTTHRGKSQAYKHTFASGSRPLLCTDGRRLYLLQGRFRVTGRGIVDIDSSGREEK